MKSFVFAAALALASVSLASAYQAPNPYSQFKVTTSAVGQPSDMAHGELTLMPPGFQRYYTGGIKFIGKVPNAIHVVMDMPDGFSKWNLSLILRNTASDPVNLIAPENVQYQTDSNGKETVSFDVTGLDGFAVLEFRVQFSGYDIYYGDLEISGTDNS